MDIEHRPDVREIMGSTPVGDSLVFVVSRSCHVDQFTFHFSYLVRYMIVHWASL